MLRGVTVVLIALIISGFSQAQETNYKTKNIQVKKAGEEVPAEIEVDWYPLLQNLEMPGPDSKSDKGRLARIKQESRKRFPVKSSRSAGRGPEYTFPDTLKQGVNFDGNPNNGIPNDNNSSISKDGIVVTCINSSILAYDAYKDSMIMATSLAGFASTLDLLPSKYDPKTIYDPIEDKFIVVFLNGRFHYESFIIVAFSETNDPNGNWNLYALSGNPLNDTTWSDYPAIAITEDEMFLTINQLRDNEPWQTGFVQTLIWQIDKHSGFNGDTVLTTKLWHDIEHEGRNIRNLNPIKGGAGPKGPNMFLLSNRNFSILTDTFFVLEVTNTLDDPETELLIKMTQADESYGAPPSARQAGNHFFETNDARVLGGFLENDHIQFVGNTLDTSTGFAAVYHGVITELGKEQPKIHGAVLGDSELDFGYPNISFVGLQNCDKESIISFNHSSTTTFAGNSAHFYSNTGTYSKRISLREGSNYVNQQGGPNERWGDYSGSQRKFDEPGKVWVGLSWADVQRRHRTWISEIISPDSTLMDVAVNFDDTMSTDCNGSINISVSGGNPPYSYDLNGTSVNQNIQDICPGDYVLTISDDYGCEFEERFSIKRPDSTLIDTGGIPIPVPSAKIFPNPVTDFTSINFFLEEDKDISIEIFDLAGQRVVTLIKDRAKKGTNLFSFHKGPLHRGMYVVRVSSGKEDIFSEKFLVY